MESKWQIIAEMWFITIHNNDSYKQQVRCFSYITRLVIHPYVYSIETQVKLTPMNKKAELNCALI